ncbi:MAG: polysaccharide deacetylase family protein [Firmicutes bacterium]|jgi:peptidoglycan/xylan/chitin deacetylase (PgdA/CDA1 family)|nr:polysaccharide deacetylase family protein [Bacillota bacterium]
MRIPAYRSAGQLVAVIFALSSIVAQATIGIMGITVFPDRSHSSVHPFALRRDGMPFVFYSPPPVANQLVLAGNKRPVLPQIHMLATASQTDPRPTAAGPSGGAPWLSMTRARPRDGQKWAVLTFDDGPSASYTPAVLDILKDEGVHAVFFVIGIQAEARPELLTRIANEGHEIGNHTYSHLNPALASYEELVNEIERTSRIVEQATGSPTVWFRPPGGSVSPDMLRAVESTRHEIVLWNVDTEDWRAARLADGDQLVVEAIAGTSIPEVSVVLMHDGGGPRNATVSALRPIIKYLKENGYRICSLMELAQETAENGAALPRVSD